MLVTGTATRAGSAPVPPPTSSSTKRRRARARTGRAGHPSSSLTQRPPRLQSSAARVKAMAPPG
eukprot:15312237-Heterocapsa_arctica.AAC.1